MKNKTTKSFLKTISLLVVAMLMLTCVTGCGSNNEKDNNNGAKETAGNTENSNFNKEGLPIVNEPVTLTVLTTRWGNMGDSFTDNQFIKDLETNTNVKIEWQVQSLSDWGEQKGILLAGGDLPDIIIGNKTFEDTDVINNLEMFLPVNDLVDEYMPNYKKALTDMPDLKKTVTYLDGKMYSMGKNLPCRPVVCNQPIINKAWLDRLGLEEPTTIEELYTVLKAFKDQDANGNGDPNDEIPITGSKGISMDLLNPFGITDINGAMMLVDEDDSLTFYPTSEQYKEGIKWLNKLYTEGIIDPETFTQDDTMALGKNQDPNVSRVGFSYNWIPDAVYGQWKDEYIALAPIAGPDGKRYAGGDKNGISAIERNEALITKNCKYPEIAARWLDEFYTGEASIQNFWGAIGTVISKNEDGTYTLNNPPEGTSADGWYWDQSLRDFGPKYVSADFQEKIKLSPESGDGLKLDLSKLGEEYITRTYPKVMLSAEEIEELATLETDINKFIDVTRADWVINGNVDEGWDTYVKRLNEMGLERLIQIRTDAMERYSKGE
ncbi:type 2 periplasmic-binding domain-containing protein [Vallitalea maricola]|uniref:ABC transporter substrate-binding protein n=1 Tax=Vallitalea maricola TaxID=3074433 RepID=A0ACB5UGQ3_9FIRM|nr:ABC transporter substrate-binding protein [Vallitalea sp. AN17-2]